MKKVYENKNEKFNHNAWYNNEYSKNIKVNENKKIEFNIKNLETLHQNIDKNYKKLLNERYSKNESFEEKVKFS
jgi:hypothetical protein